MEDKSIECVVKNQLCTGCGTCFSLCPNSAIRIDKNETKGIFTAKIDYERCSQCGKCYQVCPGHSVDFKHLNQVVFDKEPNDLLIGNYINCYIGCAMEYNIRYNSASGGLVTALLIFALEEGLIDGAVVTRMKKDSPLDPEPFIARTVDEIIEASKSKYCPVPANIALKEMLNSKEGERLAVIGLPCHIHGVRKAEQINKKLRENMVLHIGLFCSHAPSFLGTDYLLKRMRIKKQDIIKLDYRGKGWPGYLSIYEKDKQLQLQDYWGFLGSDFFTPRRCLMCCDNLSELADISFGDAWLPEFSYDKIGRSIIISRTNNGERLLQRAISTNILELDQVTAKEVKCSQPDIIYLKKKCLKARLNLFRRRPQYNTTLLEPDYIDYLLSLFLYTNHLFSQNHVSRLLLEHAPRKLLSLYYLPYNRIFSKKYRQFQGLI